MTLRDVQIFSGRDSRSPSEQGGIYHFRPHRRQKSTSSPQLVLLAHPCLVLALSIGKAPKDLCSASRNLAEMLSLHTVPCNDGSDFLVSSLPRTRSETNVRIMRNGFCVWWQNLRDPAVCRRRVKRQEMYKLVFTQYFQLLYGYFAVRAIAAAQLSHPKSVAMDSYQVSARRKSHYHPFPHPQTPCHDMS